MIPEPRSTNFNTGWLQRRLRWYQGHSADGSDFVEEREWSSLSKAPSGERPEFYFQIKSLYDTAYYDFRVRSLNRAGASSDEYTSKEWKRQIDAYQILTGKISAGRPGTAILDSNEITQPAFQAEVPGLGVRERGQRVDDLGQHRRPLWVGVDQDRDRLAHPPHPAGRPRAGGGRGRPALEVPLLAPDHPGRHGLRPGQHGLAINVQYYGADGASGGLLASTQVGSRTHDLRRPIPTSW